MVQILCKADQILVLACKWTVIVQVNAYVVARFLLIIDFLMTALVESL